MGQDMKASGKTITQMERGSSFMPLEIFMMESGLETKLMGLEPTPALTLEAATQATGKMIFNTAKVLKNGKMTATMKENSFMERRVVLVDKGGQMDQYTLGTGRTT